MEEYNRQASQFIFRENNAPGRVADDAIDVHGQFAEEAEDILEQRIRADQARGQSHLHVIVGKGNHSDGGVQKLKPRVEKVCRELGLQYATEENAGRIFVNLRPGGPAVPPPEHSGGIPPSHYKPQHVPGQEHGGGQQQHGGQQQQDELEKLAGALLPKLCKKLGDCCIVM